MQNWRQMLMVVATMSSLGCAAVAADNPASGPPSSTGESGRTSSPAPADQSGRTSSPAPVAAGRVGSPTAPSGQGDDPRISRSRGVEGGVVVLWPRIIPENNTPLIQEVAGSLQKRMTEIVAKSAPGRSVEVRPAPERSCPMAGCLAPSLGVLLLNSGNGCAVVALITPPGRSSTRLVPWAGSLTLSSEQIEFRGPPETVSRVQDFVPCDKLMEALPALEPDVEKALRAALPPH